MKASQRASGLIVMGDVVPDERPVPKTRPVHGDFLCMTCDAEFTRYQDYERHCIDCAERWEPELMRESLQATNPLLFDPRQSDVHVWMQKHRVAVLEGRKKV